MTTARVLEQLHGNQAEFTAFAEVMLRKFEDNKEKYREESTENSFHKPSNRILLTILEASDSQEKAVTPSETQQETYSNKFRECR